VSETVLKSILENRPTGIKFTQIFYNERPEARILEVHGIATDRAILRNFKSTLDANKAFSKVDLPISNFIERSDINFTVVITIK
jgi:hypothetical protein